MIGQIAWWFVLLFVVFSVGIAAGSVLGTGLGKDVSLIFGFVVAIVFGQTMVLAELVRRLARADRRLVNLTDLIRRG